MYIQLKEDTSYCNWITNSDLTAQFFFYKSIRGGFSGFPLLNIEVKNKVVFQFRFKSLGLPLILMNEKPVIP